MEAERLEAVKADETGGSQRRRSCLLEGSDDSAESRGAQQSLYAVARNERNADSLCVTRELTAAANSVPDTNIPLAVLPAFGGIADSNIKYRFAPYEGATGVYINFTAEAWLLTLYLERSGG